MISIVKAKMNKIVLSRHSVNWPKIIPEFKNIYSIINNNKKMMIVKHKQDNYQLLNVKPGCNGGEDIH